MVQAFCKYCPCQCHRIDLHQYSVSLWGPVLDVLAWSQIPFHNPSRPVFTRPIYDGFVYEEFTQA